MSSSPLAEGSFEPVSLGGTREVFKPLTHGPRCSRSFSHGSLLPLACVYSLKVQRFEEVSVCPWRASGPRVLPTEAAVSPGGGASLSCARGFGLFPLPSSALSRASLGGRKTSKDAPVDPIFLMLPFFFGNCFLKQGFLKTWFIFSFSHMISSTLTKVLTLYVKDFPRSETYSQVLGSGSRYRYF